MKVSEQGVEYVDFGVSQKLPELHDLVSFSFLICNMQIDYICFLRVVRKVKYHAICEAEMLAIIKQTTILTIRLFVHDH